MSVATDANGNQTPGGKQEFDAWGSVRSGGITATSLNYTGQRRDDTGLLYYNARYYDPAIGRFISADTIVPGAAALTVAASDATERDAWISVLTRSSEAGTDKLYLSGPANPQDLNRYSYVRNSPMSTTDSTGHCGAGDCAIIGAEIGTVIEPGGGTIVGGIIGGLLDVATIVVGTALVVNQTESLLAPPRVLEVRKKSSQTAKEAATDIPSWAKNKGVRKKLTEDGKTAAKRVMDDEYGKDAWQDNKQRKKEYSQLKKFFDRKDP